MGICYGNKLSKMSEKKIKGADGADAKKRSDWEKNHEAIRDAYVAGIKMLGKKPTITYISKELNINWNTVWRHLEDIENDLRKSPLRVLTEDIILAVARAAQGGNPQSQKLWFQIMEGWTEKTNLDVTTQGRALPRDVDLSKLSIEELKELRRLQSKIEGEGLADGQGVIT